MKRKTTYQSSGVHIDRADAAKLEMAASMISKDERILNMPGAFASLFAADFAGINQPVLVLKVEEPGSKQLLAFANNSISTICADLIHHLINDIVVMGAKPEVVLDIILCGQMEQEVVVAIVKHLANACSQQQCSLVGGETSEQPKVLAAGSYMLGASIVGVVDREWIIDGSRIQQGDLILALPSNGLHTNGYSLVRELMEQFPDLNKEQIDGESFIDYILRPHTCYYQPLKKLLRNRGIHGLAHITGGGIAANLSRIVPQQVEAFVDWRLVQTPVIFSILQQYGSIPAADMRQTFNMGVGMIAVVDPLYAAEIIAHLQLHDCMAYVIGEVK